MIGTGFEGGSKFDQLGACKSPQPLAPCVATRIHISTHAQSAWCGPKGNPQCWVRCQAMEGVCRACWAPMCPLPYVALSVAWWRQPRPGPLDWLPPQRLCPRPHGHLSCRPWWTASRPDMRPAPPRVRPPATYTMTRPNTPAEAPM